MNASCWAGTEAYITGDASPTAGIGDATFRVHAGRHADPFYFYRSGLDQTASSVRAAAPGWTSNPADCPAVDGSTSGVLVSTFNGNGGAVAVDNYAGMDVSAIVVELDTTLVTGTGAHFAIWASTHAAN